MAAAVQDMLKVDMGIVQQLQGQVGLAAAALALIFIHLGAMVVPEPQT